MAMTHVHPAEASYDSGWLYPDKYEDGVTEPALIVHTHKDGTAEPGHEHGEYYYVKLGPMMR